MALSLLYGEWFAYLVPSIWTCSWPHQRPSSSSLDGVDYPSKYVKIAVVADPQLMDRTSLRLPPKSFALEFAQFYTDLYMRRAFLSSVLPLKPDVVLFLGDYFDGVPYCRMKRYSAFNSRKLEIVKRYEREFGVRNFKVTLGNVDFIAIDAQTLDGRPQSKLTSATWDFIKNASKDIRSTPRVLLTHIPLYRPDGTPCGPHRSASIINQSLVLSAHDHDQCTVTHRSKNGPVIEQTVGTVSWQQGNLYPSFMLLSASNSTLSDGSSPENAASSQLCFLPMQTHIYLWYLSLFAMTLVIVLLWPANEVLILRKLGELMGCIRSLYNSFSNTMKEKNEDENCEYEEIWDAEGTMHLIKKKKKVSSVVLNERSSWRDGLIIYRGNIVMRSKVRKQTGQETDASTPDESIHVGSARTNKSKAKIMIWRLLRASRAILTIAAFNVPLYVLLSVRNQAASIHNGTSLHGWKSSEQNQTRIFCFVGRYSMSVVEERKSVSVAVPF
ncbi:hypothetical protein Sango_0007200 [Sesamum angolense]|uniref:Calcineurin-like phosphoesterase domain-containing protein n=1 Tax=Sesamum angolense TaxID=2727404 RepID=A0AAE1XCC8_9LAMI|nr:hypothetical protein Sango_0007200 [Sesamum angolense]